MTGLLVQNADPNLGRQRFSTTMRKLMGNIYIYINVRLLSSCAE